jgi:DNA-directed RNA polymerase specialized sigma24 family protein
MTSGFAPARESHKIAGGPAVARKPNLKKDWTATPAAFQHFLVWLDDGADSGGERYLEMRRRLVAYFARKRCIAAEDLADETLNRVARRLEEEGSIADAPPARYCYIVARFVFLESLRNPSTAHQTSLEHPIAQPDTEAAGAPALDCLDQCLGELPARDRELILEYYGGEPGQKAEQRRRLASRLGLSGNALTIRASRIRDRLEACVSGCLRKP